MTPSGEGLHNDYSRLEAYLRRIAFRLQLLSFLEFSLLLSSGLGLILLGSLVALEFKETFPYLSFIYCVIAIIFLLSFGLLGLRKVVWKPSTVRVAVELEEKFPQLRDDVTNSLLLFNQIKEGASSGQISHKLIMAQVKRTAAEVYAIKPQEVVSFRKVLRHLRLLLPLILAFSVVLALDPSFLNRSLALITHPLSTLPQEKTLLSVEPGGSVVLRGTSVIIKAKASGKMPDKLALAIWPEGREGIRLNMDPEGNGRFSYQISSVQSSFRYRVESSRVASPVYSIHVVDPPDVGKLKVTLIAPDYTGLPKEIRQEGHIEALKGTVLNLEAETTKTVKEGKVVLNQGNQFALQVKGERLVGSWPIFYPGSYSIKVKDELGFENPNPVQYQIRLIPDKYPEGEITSPGQDLEISGNEVIPILYTAKDDFGIASIKLNYQMGEKEHSIPLKSIGGRSLGPETYRWDLGSLALAPGDRVTYRLEVQDNDSVSGPKKGYSRVFNLSVRDEKAIAAKEGEEAQKIAEALLDLLADQLEGIRDKESLTRGVEEVLKRVDRNLSRMDSRAERFDLEALRRNLASLKERASQEPEEKVTQEMERLALLAEDIAKRARMNEVEALAREIRSRQRRLLDTLKDFKGPLSQKDLEAVMKELKSLGELLRSVMEALSKLATKLPDEFVNSPELNSLDFQDLFKDLEEIQKRLMAGDISGALEAAQRLLQALSEMMAALARAGAQAAMSPFDRLQGETNHQIGELGRILAEQREVLSETERIDRETRRMAELETEKRLNRSMPQFKESLDQLSRPLSPEQKDSIEELEKLLRRGELEGFSRLARELEKQLSPTPGVQERIKELREMAEGLIANPKEVMTPDSRGRFPGLSGRQENLKERTSALKDKLEMLAQLFSGMDTEILNDLKGAAGSMGEASEKLQGEDAPGAIPAEQEAIRKLTRSQQAMQQMAQQMAMRMQAARWGYNLMYDPRPGWYYGPWVPMPTLPQPEVKRPRERGYTGIDREEFEPPSKDAYQVPQLFREKVLEGMKEEAPSQYKRKVEKYFKGLTE